jgi:DNA-binding FadR family transcriptional regulator
MTHSTKRRAPRSKVGTAGPERPAPSFALARKPMKAGEALARDIVQFIVDNKLPEGTRLPAEKQMLQETGRARSTLREALRHLETRGAIRVRQGISGGPVVRQPRARDLAEVLTLILHFQGASLLDVIAAREEMEVLTVSRAARDISQRDLVELERSIERQLSQLEDREVFLRESRRFHAIINATANIPVITVLNEALQATTHVAIGDVHFDVEHRRRVALAHSKILEALRVHDGSAACEAMRAHVRESGQYWKKTRGRLARERVPWLIAERYDGD